MSHFKQGKDPAHVSLRRLVPRLAKADIPYAIMGDLAVRTHGRPLWAKGVHILLTAKGLAAFQERFVPGHYEPILGQPRSFIDRENAVTLTILVAGLSAGMGR